MKRGTLDVSQDSMKWYYTDLEEGILPSDLVGKGYGWLSYSLDFYEPGKEVKPKYTGKWLVFPAWGEQDRLWPILKRELAQNNLGISIKVSTANSPLICVYTRDYNDMTDVVRILTTLRSLGIEQRLYYKADMQTRFRLHGSIYVSHHGTDIEVTPKGIEFFEMINQ